MFSRDNEYKMEGIYDMNITVCLIIYLITTCRSDWMNYDMNIKIFNCSIIHLNHTTYFKGSIQSFNCPCCISLRPFSPLSNLD